MKEYGLDLELSSLIKNKSIEKFSLKGTLSDKEKSISCSVVFEASINRILCEDITAIITIDVKENQTSKELERKISDEPFWIVFEKNQEFNKVYIRPNFFISLNNKIEVSINEMIFINKKEIQGSQSHHYLDFKSDKSHGIISHFAKPFKLQGTFFNPIMDNRKGILLGYDYDWEKKIEDGKWSDKNWTISLGEKIICNPVMNFIEHNYFGVQAHTCLPEVSFKSEIKDLKKNITSEKIISLFDKSFKDQEIIEKAIYFTTGKRINSHSSGLYYYWQDDKTYLAVTRYKSTVNRETLWIKRSKSYIGGWELIRDISESLIKLTQKDKKRIYRAIDRYVECFEVPYLEVKLVLLHSALSILLDIEKYRDLKVSDINQSIPIKRSGKPGELPLRIAAFIQKKGLQWQDILKGRDKSELFKFNELRNDYLKDLDHEIEESFSIDILQSLFERIFLEELEISFDGQVVLK